MTVFTRPKSMFFCLYLESLVGLVVTFLVFLHLTADYVRASDAETFVDSGIRHVKNYVNSQFERDGLYGRLNRVGALTLYDYKLRIVDKYNVGQDRCEACQLFTTTHGIKVFVDGDNLFYAAFPIPKSARYLLYRELEDPFASTTAWYKNRDNHVVALMFLTMAFALAGLLYLPIRRVNKRINKLLRAQASFGQGNLSTRSEAFHISPVKEFAESFNEMASDIELRVKESMVFAQAIPHEIRTPISRIQMASDLLRREDTKDRERLFNDIDDYIQDISSLTTDILQLSRLGNGRCSASNANPERFSLSEFCKDRIKMVVGEDEVRLVIDSEGSSEEYIAVQCFAKLVLDNLLKNAVRYGCGEVELAIRSFDACWTIDIEDNGPGIPLDKRDEIFLAFSRIDTHRNVSQGGFGLGLAIANQAAKNLGWSVSVDDSYLGGARFTIVIPRTK
ncbi:HAMP domain-containing histidine kinase [Vibrio sp. ZSDZ65]|uniref:histidine kinase n=1 Tax=Vibrio qingdaonensis TaxID=2829491 RepID=A0A9X3HVS3_9VIBR|nr:HAMP domain-containing sensor histidine kinase [Vibrio qingdaonensis]MCW8345518.1 HAMP domain-containing histidine kinase [Vibrio qingdaonensis]